SSSFFLTDPPTPELYTLSLHDALPISALCAEDVRNEWATRRMGITGPTPLDLPDPSPLLLGEGPGVRAGSASAIGGVGSLGVGRDRKSTRLNSSHLGISYAVFCLKKKR